MRQWPNKDPDEVLDYELDWANEDDPRLELSETLVTSLWTVVEGDVVINSSSFAPSGLSTVWLSGGTDGTLCVLNNKVTTSKARTYDEDVKLRIRSRAR